MPPIKLPHRNHVRFKPKRGPFPIETAGCQESAAADCGYAVRRPAHRPRAFDKARLNTTVTAQAPVGRRNNDVERQLKQLVSKFGEKKIREALDPLITRCKWNDWQCVGNAIRRIACQK